MRKNTDLLVSLTHARQLLMRCSSSSRDSEMWRIRSETNSNNIRRSRPFWSLFFLAFYLFLPFCITLSRHAPSECVVGHIFTWQRRRQQMQGRCAPAPDPPASCRRSCTRKRNSNGQEPPQLVPTLSLCEMNRPYRQLPTKRPV
jgi:hypothetical protein